MRQFIRMMDPNLSSLEVRFLLAHFQVQRQAATCIRESPGLKFVTARPSWPATHMPPALSVSLC